MEIFLLYSPGVHQRSGRNMQIAKLNHDILLEIRSQKAVSFYIVTFQITQEKDEAISFRRQDIFVTIYLGE